MLQARLIGLCSKHRTGSHRLFLTLLRPVLVLRRPPAAFPADRVARAEYRLPSHKVAALTLGHFEIDLPALTHSWRIINRRSTCPVRIYCGTVFVWSSVRNSLFSVLHRFRGSASLVTPLPTSPHPSYALFHVPLPLSSWFHNSLGSTLPTPAAAKSPSTSALPGLSLQTLFPTRFKRDPGSALQDAVYRTRVSPTA